MNNIFKVSYYDEQTFRYVTEYRNNFGLLHREDGPAIEYSDGDYEYYINGKLHNAFGPARKMKNCEKTYFEYYFYGKQYSDLEDFYKKQYKGIKLKQKMRELKFNKMLNKQYVLSLINIENNKEKEITRRWNDLIEVYINETEEYDVININNISKEKHLIVLKNNKFKIVNIKEEDND
jgi:hypothetical protein